MVDGFELYKKMLDPLSQKIKDYDHLVILPHGILSGLPFETFEQSPIKTNNMYLIELSEKFKLNQVFQIDKFRNKFPRTIAHSNDIKKNGLFDFIDYHDLGDNEFLFFMNDNEKNSKNRKKNTLYGIVSYSDGVFKKQTLNLKTESSSMNIYPSKKGYAMIVENFDLFGKPTELRLEKINY